MLSKAILMIIARSDTKEEYKDQKEMKHIVTHCGCTDASALMYTFLSEFGLVFVYNKCVSDKHTSVFFHL